MHAGHYGGGESLLNFLLGFASISRVFVTGARGVRTPGPPASAAPELNMTLIIDVSCICVFPGQKDVGTDRINVASLLTPSTESRWFGSFDRRTCGMPTT